MLGYIGSATTQVEGLNIARSRESSGGQLIRDYSLLMTIQDNWQGSVGAVLNALDVLNVNGDYGL